MIVVGNQDLPVVPAHLAAMHTVAADCRIRYKHFVENRQYSIASIRWERRKRHPTGFVVVETERFD